MLLTLNTQEFMVGAIRLNGLVIGYMSYTYVRVSDNEYRLVVLEIRLQGGWWN